MPAARHTLRTRLMMAGAFIGAILALSLNWAFSVDGTPNQPSAAERARTAALNAQPGSCLTWSKPRASDARTIRCDKPHLFEVTSVQNISKRYPPGSKAPGLEQWRGLADKLCGKNIESYLGQPLDPHGRYSLNILRPNGQQWAAGQREVRCGLQRTGPGGSMLTTTGHAAKQPQSSVFEPGTCLGLKGKAVGDPVECTEPHAYEIVATVDLTEQFKFTDGYPSEDDQQAWLDTECNAALDEYSGDADLSDKGLSLSWEIVQKKSWLAGSTKVNCYVGKPLEDGSGLASITGSIGKGQPSGDGAPTGTSGGR